MALSLNQLNSKNDKKSSQDESKKNIRPWKTSVDIGQSYAGNHAAKKAREIAAKNDGLINQIRLDGASLETVSEIESIIRTREKQFEELEFKNIKHQKIKSKGEFLSKFKRALFDH